MEISRKEVLRYLGYGVHKGDDAVNDLVEECIRELEGAASPKCISRVYPLELLPDYEIDFTVFRTRSRNLSKNMADCNQVILFAATLGTGVDVLLHKYTKLQMSKAVTLSLIHI